ncbi:MAG TPA: hypothetical protein VKB12_11495 [Pyrinomonadaceae bacterium]|nr:hypothetical protein [Pyrinomonadaceae bacterium]
MMRSQLTLRNVVIALAACLLLARAAVAGGQSREGEAERQPEAVADKRKKEAAAGRKKKKSARASESRAEGEKTPRRVRLFAKLSTVFDSNVEHDERRLRSFGLVPSLGFHFQDDAEKPSFEAEYEVGFHRYTRTDSFDRVSHYLTAAYRKKLPGRFSSRTTGEVSLKGSSEDRDVNNQYSLEQQFQYRLTPATRLSAFAAYRLKRYPLADAGKNAIDPYVGGKFQQELKGGREWELSYRYDKNRPQDPKDRYVRWTYEAQFSTPLFRSRRDLLTVEARYSPRLYARQIKVDGERVARKDRRWVFEFDYERPLARDVRLGLGYKYETRGSNDPDKRFDAHVFGVTFGFDWWRR